MNRSTRTEQLRGQMAVKSSPMNPNRGKLVSQHLIIDHMSAHYKKLLNAKSAIDASVPEAYRKSQQVRDRETRKQVLSGKPKRPTSAQQTYQRTGAKNGTPGRRHSARLPRTEEWVMDEDDYDGFTQDERDRINSLVNETLNTERMDRFLKEDGSLPAAKPSSRSGSGSAGMRTNRSAAPGLTMDTAKRKKMSADILDKRGHAFTEGNEFTPRALKNPKYQHVPSKLSQTKVFRPAQPPSAKKKSGAYPSSHAESELLDETLMSRDFTTRLTMSGTVPKLNITIDQDHMKWLQDQSARRESSSYTPLDSELRSQGLRTAAAAGDTPNTYTRKKIEKEDEELLYLDFITGVTNDVLTRGIFTNRVLNKVFDEHVEKNKHQLSEDRMRSMLDDLRQDLGIRADNQYAPEDPDDVGMGAVRPSIRSKSKSSGYTGDISQFKAVRLGQERGGAYERGGTREKLADDADMAATFTAKPNPAAPVTEERQDLGDIAELSEKSASQVSALAPVPASRERKASADDFAGSLGLDDVVAPVTRSQPADDNGSVHSKLSTHSSDRTLRAASNKTASDKTAAKRTEVKPEATISDRDGADGVSDRASHSSSRSKPVSRVSGRSRHASTSGGGAKSASGAAAAVWDSDGSPEHKRSDEENQEELESNADFGKTTLFAKTRDMNLTYKALSQASEGDDDEPGNGSDYDYDFD